MLIYATKQNENIPLVVEGIGKLKDIVGELESIIGSSCTELEDDRIKNYEHSPVIKKSIECNGNTYFMYAQKVQMIDTYSKNTELNGNIPSSLARINIYPNNSEGFEVLSKSHDTINQMGEDYLKQFEPTKVEKAVSLIKDVGSYEINAKDIGKSLNFVFLKPLKLAKNFIL